MSVIPFCITNIALMPYILQVHTKIHNSLILFNSRLCCNFIPNSSCPIYSLLYTDFSRATMMNSVKNQTTMHVVLTIRHHEEEPNNFYQYPQLRGISL